MSLFAAADWWPLFKTARSPAARPSWVAGDKRDRDQCIDLGRCDISTIMEHFGCLISESGYRACSLGEVYLHYGTLLAVVPNY